MKENTVKIADTTRDDERRGYEHKLKITAPLAGNQIFKIIHKDRNKFTIWIGYLLWLCSVQRNSPTKCEMIQIIHFVQWYRCSSYVGMHGGINQISLQGGCDDKRTALHDCAQYR